MASRTIYLIDTSVFLEILNVPGRASQPKQVQAEFVRRYETGSRFVLPVTTLIEAGNFIAQCDGDRRGAAQRYEAAIRSAQSSTPPWAVRDVAWDQEFLTALLDGGATRMRLVDHLSARVGTGDIAILVELQQFRASIAITDVRLWTLDAQLDSYS